MRHGRGCCIGVPPLYLAPFGRSVTVGMTIGKKYWQETDNIVKVNRTAGLKPDSLGNLRHGHSLMRCSHPFAKNAKGWGTRH
jgi:hypothetical protein